MSRTDNLLLPYIAPAQAQKHVTYNEGIRILDSVVQLAVLDRDQTSPPTSPAEGDRHIVAAAAAGLWAGQDGHIAAWVDGAWTYFQPQEGWRAWLISEAALVVWSGAAWIEVSGGSSSSASTFGVNAMADTTNRLSVSSPACLFNHEGAGHQLKINKNAAGDTGSVLFQTGFSGRAEFGLIGDDDFHVKVTADGSSWSEALTIDKDNGYVGVAGVEPHANLHVQHVDSTFASLATTPSQFHIVCQNTGNTTHHYKGGIGFKEGDHVVAGMAPVDSGTGANTSLVFFTGGASSIAEQIRIEAGGDVGIGLVNPSSKLHVNGGVQIGSPTGGDKGMGALNAEAVYDDNALLSCYVFDQFIDGEIDIEKWDRKVPDRVIPEKRGTIERRGLKRDPETGAEVYESVYEEDVIEPEKTVRRTHEPLRKFAARAGTQHDPLMLDGYARHWREKRHLSSMPNEVGFDPVKGLAAGEWVQRLVETVEIQAILIEELNQRTKTLKQRPSR